MHSNFYLMAKRFPPVLCRLLARERAGRAKTTEELSRSCGMSVARVDSISRCASWSGIDVIEMELFTKACGVDFSSRKDMHRVKMYLRGKRNGLTRTPPAFRYLRQSAEWTTLYMQLLDSWKNHVRK